MMNIKTLLIAAIVTSLCFITSANADVKLDAQKAIGNAQSLWGLTIEAGHEWTTIKPLVAQAEQALKSNNFTEALSLATQASAQSKHALIQAEFEKTNWANNLPK